jgi:hypothetical protein
MEAVGQPRTGRAIVMIDLKSHPHVKAIRNEHDEDGQITIVVTDLVVVRENPRFDEAAFGDLVRHVEAWQAEGVRRVTIEGPA